jgi:putative ABC transport system permease protein
MRYAIRMLLKNPASTLLAVLSLATGMGSVTLMFSIVDAVLVRPLPYPQSDRLVFVWFVPPSEPNEKRAATVASYQALLEQEAVFDHVGTIGGVGDTATLAGAHGEPAEQVEGQRFSAAVPHALGATPLMGRWFTEAEAAGGSYPVIVISHRLWQRRFGGDPRILDKSVRLDGEAATIIGVMPDGWMLFNYPAQFWAPYRVGAGGDAERVLPLARLKSGVDLRRAQSAMNRLAANLSEAFPSTNKGWGIRLEPAREVYVGWIRRPLLIAQGVALIVLLIACANAAGILLAQVTARVREIGVRVALGAGPWRIARDLACESALICLCATLSGFLIAYAGLKLFLAISPSWFPRAAEIALHARALAATASISVLTALTLGAIPAWQAFRLDLVPAIAANIRRASAGTLAVRFRSALVVLQLSAALALLTGAGLMINSFIRLYHSSLGCDTSNLMTFQIRFPPERFANSQMKAACERIRERIAGIPGVAAVAFGEHAPFSESMPGPVPFTIEGRPSTGEPGQTAIRLAVSPAYFGVLKAPVVRGREFRREDTSSSTPVALVNERIARRFWPAQSPLGKRIRLAGASEPSREIVGVVGDLRQDRRAHEAEMQIYVPSTQLRPAASKREAEAGLSRIFLVRAADSASFPLVRAAVSAEEPGLPIFNIKSVGAYIAEQLWQPRQTMILLGIFGAVAVLLAMSGVFGIVTYMVGQRMPEIGIRIALGAMRGDVMRLVLAHGLRLAALGISAGIFGSFVLARLLRSLLWGIAGTDVATYAAAITFLILAAILACYLPARRASCADPLVALRFE